MTAVCRVLVDHVFVELGLNQAGIVCVVENKRSHAIPKRKDFQREGVQRQAEWLYDHFVDHTVYAALASGEDVPSSPNLRELSLRQLERSPKPSS